MLIIAENAYNFITYALGVPSVHTSVTISQWAIIPEVSHSAPPPRMLSEAWMTLPAGNGVILPVKETPNEPLAPGNWRLSASRGANTFKCGRVDRKLPLPCFPLCPVSFWPNQGFPPPVRNTRLACQGKECWVSCFRGRRLIFLSIRGGKSRQL